MNSDCEIKIKELQRHVTSLEDLIETLKEDSTKGPKLRQMQLLHKLLTNPETGVTLDMLLKSEEVLDKIFGNIQKGEVISPGCDDSVKEDITESLNRLFHKMDGSDADEEANSEKCSKEHSEEKSEQSCDNKTEKETNSNNSEPEISEKSKDQNKDVNLQGDDQSKGENLKENDQNNDESLQEEKNKDENLQEEIEEKEVPIEDISDNQNDPLNNFHESQEELLKDDQPEKEISEEVDSEVIPTEEIIQQEQNHEQDVVEDNKEENKTYEIDEILEEGEKKEETPQKMENDVIFTNENIQEGKSNKQDIIEKKEEDEKSTSDDVLENNDNNNKGTPPREETTNELLEEKGIKKKITPPRVKTMGALCEEKENKDSTPSEAETRDELLEEKEITPLRVETIDALCKEKENNENTPSGEEIRDELLTEKEITPLRAESVDTLCEEKEKQETSSGVKIKEDLLEKKENEREATPTKLERTSEEDEEPEENKENETEENNDEIQIVQTSSIYSEKSKSCDENKVKTERNESTEKQSKKDQNKKVDVPEKFTETDIKKEDNNDIELDSVEEVKVGQSVKNKKQTSLNEQNNKLNKAASSSESTSKRVLPKRSKPIESNSTVKAIELKPKDPSEKSAVVYLVKKGAPKPMETIDLLDTDSEDDDVILVSEVGLKKRTPAAKTAAKRMMPANKTPQIPAKVPSVIRQSTQGNKLMFAITSVKSIGQQEQQKRQQQQHTQIAQVQRNKNLIISPAKVRTQGIYSPGTITFHKVKQSQSAGVPPRTYIGVKKSSPLVANKFVNRLNSQIVISSVGSTAGTSNTKPTVGIANRSSTQNNQIVQAEDPANDLAILSAQEQESPWNPDKDCQRSKDWLENFLSNVLSPTQNVTPFGVDLLQRSLDIPVFVRIRAILEENKKVFVSTLDKDVKVMHKNTDEIMALFFRDGSLTDAGVKLATFAKQAMNRVFTTDRRTGHITSKSRKKPKELDDDEYSPSVIVEFAQETVANRRRSLRRESKTNRKQYFAYEDDDDAEFLEMVEEQARIEANNRANKIHKIHKKPGPRRSNGSTSSSELPSVKKMRLEEGTSVETPFETDLLKPTWVEDAVGEAYQDQFNEEADMPEDDQEEQDGVAEYSYQEEEQEEEKQKQTEPVPEGKINTWKMSRLGRYHSKWKNFKNINRAHHCRSTFIDSCILCNVKHNFVVAHYVNHHRETEVLIARLTQRDVDQLVRSVNYGYLTASKSTAHQYSATCVFCKREMTFALRYWWEHYSMHTGEYGYECTKCFLRRPRRQHAQKHANNECHLGPAKVRIIYDFDKTMNQIDAYICKLCNYIQIHKENVVKHIKIQHEIQNDLQTNIIRVVLLQIARPCNEDNPGQDSLNNSNSFDYYDSFNGGMSIGADNSYSNYDPNDESDVTYMQYSGGMMGHDDLSFMICDMLATDDPTQQLPPSTSFSFDTSSTVRKDGGGTK